MRELIRKDRGAQPKPCRERLVPEAHTPASNSLEVKLQPYLKMRRITEDHVADQDDKEAEGSRIKTRLSKRAPDRGELGDVRGIRFRRSKRRMWQLLVRI